MVQVTADKIGKLPKRDESAYLPWVKGIPVGEAVNQGKAENIPAQAEEE